MLQESREQIVHLYRSLRERGEAEFDQLLPERSYCMFEESPRVAVEEVFDLAFRRRRDRAEIHLRMPPPGEEVEVVLDRVVRATVELDLREPEHLLVDGNHLPDLDAVAAEIMDQAMLALEE